MVINGSCSTNMCARQLSFNFSSMFGGHGPVAPPLDPPLPVGDLVVTYTVHLWLVMARWKARGRIPITAN